MGAADYYFFFSKPLFFLGIGINLFVFCRLNRILTYLKSFVKSKKLIFYSYITESVIPL